MKWSSGRRWLKKKWLPILIAVALWAFLSFSGVQEWFFHGGDIKTIVLMKAIHLVCLILLMMGLFEICRRSKRDRRYKDWLIIGGIYFTFLMIILLMVWPGTWAWDDIVIVYNAEYYWFTPWQHFLSGAWHILAFQTIPIAGGLAIMQSFVAALMVGYVGAFLGRALSDKYKLKFWWVSLLLVLPFCLLPVIYYVLGGYRMGIYQYLEIFVFAMILVKYLTREKISWLWVGVLVIVAILVGAWRTEGAIAVLVIPICLALMKNRFWTWKRLVCLFLILLAGVGVIGKVNNSMIQNNNYMIGAIVLPLVESIRSDDGIAEEKIEAVDKVLDMDCLHEHPELTAEHIYHKCISEKYTEEEYGDFARASLGIIVTHKRVSLDAIVEMFRMTTMGQYDEQNRAYGWTTAVEAVRIFDPETTAGKWWNETEMKGKGALNLDLRNAVINFLAGTPDEQPSFYQPIFWNHIVPIVLSGLVVVGALVKKKWLYAVMGLGVLGRTAVVAATAMAPFFMYYMPVHIAGYELAAIAVVILCGIWRSGKNCAKMWYNRFNMAKGRFSDWFKKHYGVMAVILAVVVSFVLLFRFVVPVNVNNMGGTHSWLFGSTVKFVDYWLEEGAANLNFTNYESPDSIEFETLEDRIPYLSYPTGETFFVYMAARLTGRASISISFLHKFQLVMFALEAAMLGIFVYYFMLRTMKYKKELGKIVVSSMVAVLWMLLPTCAYYLTNVYFTDQCVILWAMALTLIEYLIVTSERRSIGLKIVRTVVLFSGMLIDYYFWILAGVFFVMELIRVILGGKKGDRKKKLLGVVGWFVIPMGLGVLTYYLQLIQTSNWVSMLTEKFNFRIGSGQTLDWMLASLNLNFVEAFSLDPGMINYLLLIFAVVVVGGIWALIKEKKLKSLFLNPGLSIIVGGTLAIILQIAILKQHSAIHEFSMIKVGWIVAILPILMTMLMCYVLKIKNNETTELMGKKIGKVPILGVVSCAFVAAVVGVPVSTIKFVNNRWEIANYSLEQSIKNNTGYSDVLFSYSEVIPLNPPLSLAVSHKVVYKIDDVNKIIEKMDKISDEAVEVLVVNKNAKLDAKLEKQQECLVKNGDVRWENEDYSLVDLRNIEQCNNL